MNGADHRLLYLRQGLHSMSAPTFHHKVLRRGGPGLGRLVGWLVFASAGVSITSCASRSDNAAFIAHGEALAQQSCGGCHGLGLAGTSSFPGAPSFRDMQFDYNAIAYERSMATWHLGHVNMPPAELSMDDVRDIGAYVQSLRRPDRDKQP